MNKAMPATQRGLTFFGFILGAIILVLVSIIGLKLIPAYMEYLKINNTFTAMSNAPELQKASLRDIHMAFNNRALIDSITAIKADDIEVDNSSGRTIFSASYAVKVPLAGNVSLYLEFNPTSAK